MTLTVEQTVIACLVLHVLSDFTLQTLGSPSLADLKQQAWWTYAIRKLAERANDSLRLDQFSVMLEHCRNDYKPALLCHSLVWAALTFLPLCAGTGWSMIVAVNAGVHYLIDDLKANRLKINLVTDQALHACQIGLTLGGYFLAKFLMGG